jgi:hypothetical protein
MDVVIDGVEGVRLTMMTRRRRKGINHIGCP